MESVPIRILFFKSKNCAFCAPVERMVRKAVSRFFGDEFVTVNVFDVDEHDELIDEYNITSLPYVIVDDVPVISGMVDEKEVEEALMKGVLRSAPSRAERLEVGAKQVFIEANLNFVKSINSKERIRKNIGDYVHISNLQLATISLLSLDASAGNLLYSIGKLAGKMGAFTSLLYDIKPELGDPYMSIRKKFSNFLTAIDRFHLKQNQLGVFDARNAEVVEEGECYGRVRIYELATAVGVPVIGEPLCCFTAGMLSGLAEAILGESVYVVERDCWGLGASYCEFELSLNEEMLEGRKTAAHPARKGVDREESFNRLIKTLFRNMVQSILEGRKIRVGISDYTHIMNLQQQVTSIKLADPVADFFLRLAGKRLGKLLAPSEEMEAREAIIELKNIMNSPFMLMSGIHSNCNVEVLSDKSFLVTVDSCALASGQENIGVSLCGLEKGFIEGFMEQSTGKPFSSKEVECWGLGYQHCKFHVEME
ncbi:MAG: V4R domain-containing protein [Candidatus Jordarchaeales archaeon]